MTIDPNWNPAAGLRAGGDVGKLLRAARVSAGLTLTAAGAKAGYSASALSRRETGRGRGWSVAELRHLAQVYGIPTELLGLAASEPATEPGIVTLGSTQDSGGDPMRRRDLLAGTVLATASAVLPGTTAAAGVTDTIEDVIFGRVTAAPLAAQQLAAQLATAVGDFRACRYVQLARRLPHLIAQAAASRTAAPAGQHAAADGQVSRAYAIATQLLIKLHDNGMAWATADRAVQAANASGDPLIQAQATRLAATVLRRTRHRDGAQRLILDGADRLARDTALTAPEQAAAYAQMLAAAAYTAAIRDDRDTAWTLLNEADTAHHRASTSADALTAVDLQVYKVSIARALGDYGAAVDHARRVDPTRITSSERRARYWEDTALALHGRGRPAAAFNALRTAEADTPQEVRYRPWAQNLTTSLLSEPRHTLPGITAFAQRVGAL